MIASGGDYALRWGQEDRGGFRCPPRTLLDLPYPSPDDQGLTALDPGLYTEKGKSSFLCWRTEFSI